MKTGNFIDMQEVYDYKKTNLKTYQCLIRKLMYLLCRTRPNILFVVGQLSRQNANPCIGHLKAVKRVVCYLKGIMHLGLIYSTILQSVKQTNTSMAISIDLYGLSGYADSNYPSDPKD